MKYLLCIMVILIIYVYYKLFCDIKNEFLKRSNLKILHLVLYSNNKEYDMMYDVTRNYYKNFTTITTIYYKFSDKYKVITLKDDILHIPGKETYIPGILDKTIEAYKYYYNDNNTYDYIIRSNISTVINFKLLMLYLIKNPFQYGGGMIIATHWEDNDNGVISRKYWQTPYVSGTAIIMSHEMFNKFMSKIDFIDHKQIDDAAIGRLMLDQFPDIKVHDINHFLHVDDDNINNEDVFFYRNKSDDRKKDVKNMKYIVNKLNNI